MRSERDSLNKENLPSNRRIISKTPSLDDFKHQLTHVKKELEKRKQMIKILERKCGKTVLQTTKNLINKISHLEETISEQNDDINFLKHKLNIMEEHLAQSEAENQFLKKSLQSHGKELRRKKGDETSFQIKFRQNKFQNDENVNILNEIWNEHARYASTKNANKFTKSVQIIKQRQCGIQTQNQDDTSSIQISSHSISLENEEVSRLKRQIGLKNQQSVYLKEELSFMAMKISDFYKELDLSSSRHLSGKKSKELERNYQEVLEIFDINQEQKERHKKLMEEICALRNTMKNLIKQVKQKEKDLQMLYQDNVMLQQYFNQEKMENQELLDQNTKVLELLEYANSQIIMKNVKMLSYQLAFSYDY